MTAHTIALPRIKVRRRRIRRPSPGEIYAAIWVLYSFSALAKCVLILTRKFDPLTALWTFPLTLACTALWWRIFKTRRSVSPGWLQWTMSILCWSLGFWWVILPR